MTKPAALLALLVGATSAATHGQTSGLPLLKQADLTYVGAFRVPIGSDLNVRPLKTYRYGGTALTYSGHDTLYMVGHDWDQLVGEFDIPEPSQATTIDELPRAKTVQPWTDILRGKLKTVDGTSSTPVMIGGLLPVGPNLVVSAWRYYDAGPNKQTKTHFVTGQNFAELGEVAGPFQVGIGFQEYARSDTTRIGGFVSGYMTPIPVGWQSELGGTHLTGQGGMISILGRTSAGPSATVFTPAELGQAKARRAWLVMGYPIGHPIDHPTLGKWGVDGALYNGTQGFRGVVFPEGTRSILFIGWGADHFCYGAATSDPAKHRQPIPGTNQHYCYDPVIQGGTGPHSYPVKSLVFAYDVNDFIAVKKGKKRPWDVKPYTTWTFSLPFQEKIVNGVDRGHYEIVGATYDPAGRRLFLSAARTDGEAPLVHVLKLQ